MLQVERALSAAARPWRAAVPQSQERNALGRHPQGPPSGWQERLPPLEGAGVVAPPPPPLRSRQH